MPWIITAEEQNNHKRHIKMWNLDLLTLNIGELLTDIKLCDENPTKKTEVIYTALSKRSLEVLLRNICFQKNREG